MRGHLVPMSRWCSNRHGTTPHVRGHPRLVRISIHTVRFQTDYPTCPPTEHGERVRLQLIDRPPRSLGNQRVMCWYDVKGFCFFGYFSCWSSPRRVFTTLGDDPHFTVPCSRPGRIGGWRRRWRWQPSGPGQYTFDGRVYSGSLAGPVPCDERDRSLSPEHKAENL